MDGEGMQLSNKVYRDGLEWQNSNDKELSRLFWNKFNVLDFSTWFCSDLLCAFNMVQVIEGKIV